MDALHEAIRLVGGTQAALAEAINKLRDGPEIGQSAISNWFQRGKVPAERVLDVAMATQFAVTPHDLRPDLYPNAADGLPADREAEPGRAAA